MKVLVVFYSRTGTTKRVGEALAEMLDCDSEELLDTQKRSGPLGVMMAGRDARAKKLTTLAGIKHDPALYDLVILGTPIWAYTLSSAVRTFITTNKSKFKQVAFFCTQGTQGCTESQQVFAEMEALCDRHPVNTLALNNTEVERGAYQDKLRQFADELQAP
ncbi:MAG: flavodoxin family protein [Halobacteriota archaeon]